MPSIYRVAKKRVYDGVNSQPNVFAYDYSSNGSDTGAVNEPANSPNSICISTNPPTNCKEYHEWYSELRGHGQVTETAPGGRQTITTYHQDDVLKGRPISTTVKSGSQILSETIYGYTSDINLPVADLLPADCPSCRKYPGVFRVRVTDSSVENHIYAGDGSILMTTRQILSYDATYGNLTRQQDQAWDGSAWVTYRTTSTDYFPNTTGVYLVGLPARQWVKDARGNVIAESLNLYNSHSSYNVAPTAGKLTAVRSWVDGALTTGRYNQTGYGYDTWGNQIRVTNYSGYGSASTAPVTGMRSTTTTFDPNFHVYPISQTTPPTQNAPLGLTTSWSYDYDTNGQNDYLLGVPTREVDPNGNVTSARYDGFGRMTRLIRPGDDSAHPTVAIDYHDTNLFWTEIRQRINAGRHLTIRRHYDGTGRQTDIENGHTSAGVFQLDNLVSYRYSGLNITKQSMPYAPGATASYTTTESDILGRPLTITAPNGNVTSYGYDGLKTTVTDPEGNPTVTFRDAWQRVTQIVSAKDENQNPLGPDVTYTYDELIALQLLRAAA